MTSHELARRLLEQEDKKVVISDEGDYNEIRDIGLTQDGDEVVMRLFRL